MERKRRRGFGERLSFFVFCSESLMKKERREATAEFLPPIDARSLPEHEAVSEAAALLLLRCRLAERREASMAC